MSFPRRLGSATTVLCVLAASILLLPTSSAAHRPSTDRGHRTALEKSLRPHKAHKKEEVLPGNSAGNKIYSLIRIAAPHQGKNFARSATQIICQEARRAKLPPLYCAAVAYAESHFDSNAGPCIGIYQVHRSSLREYVRRKEGHFSDLDPDIWRDNIRIGIRELALHKRSKHTLRGTLARYNGCGLGGRYVDRVMDIYKRLGRTNASSWIACLQQGQELWA